MNIVLQSALRKGQLAELDSSLPDSSRTLCRRKCYQRRAEVQLFAEIALKPNTRKNLRRNRRIESTAAAPNYSLAITKTFQANPSRYGEIFWLERAVPARSN